MILKTFEGSIRKDDGIIDVVLTGSGVREVGEGKAEGDAGKLCKLLPQVGKLPRKLRFRDNREKS